MAVFLTNRLRFRAPGVLTPECMHGDRWRTFVSPAVMRRQGKRLEPIEIERYLNQYLPEDICVYGLEQVPERFHSRLSAVGKTYCYRIWTAERKPVFERRYVWWLPGELDIEAMRQAAECLTGTHDYMSFCGNPKMKKSTVRTVDKIEITEQNGIVTLCFHGDGFLQNMVRILTGTLVEAGRGRMKPESMSEILDKKARTAAGPMAPAQGLCLESVDYERERKSV